MGVVSIKRYLLGLSLPCMMLFTSCSHTIVMRNYDADLVNVSGLEGKKIAIVMDSQRVPDRFRTKTDMYSYNFTEMSAGLSMALDTVVRRTGKLVEIKQAEAKPSLGEFDLLLYPEVKARTVNDFWTFGCLVNFRLEIRDKSGKTVADESSESKRNFPSAYLADSKCNEAMAEAFRTTVRKAFRSFQN
jgi:hypothetical protein